MRINWIDTQRSLNHVLKSLDDRTTYTIMDVGSKKIQEEFEATGDDGFDYLSDLWLGRKSEYNDRERKRLNFVEQDETL